MARRTVAAVVVALIALATIAGQVAPIAGSPVLTGLLVLHFGGLVVLILCDPAGHGTHPDTNGASA